MVLLIKKKKKKVFKHNERKNPWTLGYAGEYNGSLAVGLPSLITS